MVSFHIFARRKIGQACTTTIIETVILLYCPHSFRLSRFIQMTRMEGLLSSSVIIIIVLITKINDKIA